MSALFLLWAGFLVQIPTISAQEVLSQEADSLRAAERSLVIEEGAEAAAPSSGPSIWTVFRMILTLALAAAAIYGVVFLIRRPSKQAVNVNDDPFLKVLANAHLGSNRYAHVVAVGGRAWLLGSSDGGVNLIGEIEDKDILNAMMLEDSRKSAPAQGRFLDFLGILRRLGVPAETSVPGAGDIRKRRERLKRL